MTRPRLRIVYEDHDEVIAKGRRHRRPVWRTQLPFLRERDVRTHGKGLTRHQLRLFRTVVFDDYMVLDPSEVPIENPAPYQLAARGPVPAWWF